MTFTDVWGGFEDRVGLASARYRADAVLIGRVRPGVLGYDVEWLLLKDGVRQPIAGIGAARRPRRGGRSLCRRALHDRRRELRAAHGARRRHVRGLRPRSELSRNLSVLQSVDVESLERGVLSLRVAARGDARVIERVLALGGVLQPGRRARVAAVRAAASGAARVPARAQRHAAMSWRWLPNAICIARMLLVAPLVMLLVTRELHRRARAARRRGIVGRARRLPREDLRLAHAARRVARPRGGQAPARERVRGADLRGARAASR